MKKAIVISLFGMVLGGLAAAQPVTTPSAQSATLGFALSDLTGLQVLKIVAVERKLVITDERLVTLRSTPPADREFIQLCLSKITYDALVISRSNRVAQVLATRAALEAASCKTFSTAAIQSYLNSGALKPIVTAEDLANQIRRPIIGGGVTAVDGTSITPVRP